MKIIKFLFVSLLYIQLFASIWFAQSQPPATREISVQISGFRSTGDRFIFKDHNSREHTFDSNQTRSLGRFLVGSNYSLTQTSGPRQCRMTNNQGVVPDRDIVISIDCSAALQTAQREFSIQISGFQSNSDRFIFRDHNLREHIFDSNGTKIWGRFSVGSVYNLTQTSGPRQCRLTNNQGTVANSDVIVSINCAAPPPTAERELSIQISGFRSTGDRFVFKDQNAREHIFDSNQTRVLGSFPVGSNYSLTQTTGPRQCRMTNNQGVVPATDLLIVVDCTNSTSNPTPTPPPTSGQYKIKVAWEMNMISNQESEKFEFALQGTTEKVTIKSGNMLGIFSRNFSSGQNYKVIQVSGPRNCQLESGEGTVANRDVVVVARCGHPPSIGFKINVSGIEQGESFSFTDNYESRRHIFPVSTTTTLGNFFIGDNYRITQTEGSRQCRMTKNQGIVPNSEVIVLADCAKTTIENPAPTGKFGDFDLISRSSDQKSFGTFYGSITPSIGGINDTGVTEGQFVAYMTSWNLDPKHGGKARQIMWFNRGNGRVAVASHAPDGIGGDKDSYNPSIDNKGYTVAFESLATNLVQGDANKVSDIFVWTLMDDTVRCVTCSGNYGSIDASLSGDGNYVAFTSYANNLTAGVEGNTAANVYLANLRTGEITLISKDPKTGKGVSGMHPSVSEDGSRVAFYSYSDKLVDGDNNKLWDIFVWERGNPQLKRVSLTSDGMERDQGSESMSRVIKPAISGNGKYVTFATTAKNMGGSPTGKAQNVYVVEIDTGRVVRASEGIENTAGNDDSPVEQGERIPISYDGKWVAFTTKATNLGGKIILRNIETGETIPFITEGSGGVGTPTLSRNGKCIAFPSNQELDKRFKSTGIFTACR